MALYQSADLGHETRSGVKVEYTHMGALTIRYRRALHDSYMTQKRQRRPTGQLFFDFFPMRAIFYQKHAINCLRISYVLL